MAFSAEDRHEIEALIVEHAWLLDHGPVHDLADLYTEDGRLTGAGFQIIGRTQMIASLSARPPNTTRQTHHQCTNIRIISAEAGQARGWVSLVLRVRQDEGSVTEEFVGEYHDRYIRDAQRRWRFAERKLIQLGIIDENESL